MKHWHGGGVGEGGGAGPGWVVCSFIYSLCLYRRKIHYHIISSRITTVYYFLTCGVGPLQCRNMHVCKACRQICRKEREKRKKKSALRYWYVIISWSCVGYRIVNCKFPDASMR